MLFSYIAKKLKFLQESALQNTKASHDTGSKDQENGIEEKEEREPGGKKPEGDKPPKENPTDNARLDKELEKNLLVFKRIFGGSGDVIVHEIAFGPDDERKGAIVFIDGLVSSSQITEGILKPVLAYLKQSGNARIEDTIEELKSSVICLGEISSSRYYCELAKGCADGDTVFLFDGFEQGLVINTKGWDKRGVTEPQSETVVRGPREGFTESVRTNTALIRRRIKTPQLRMDHMTIGRQTKTSVCVAYIEGIAKPDVIKRLKYRLSKIDVDSIMDSGYIEQFIEDAPFSVYRTVGYSEKPDVVVSKVLEGRAAIIVDGSPFVLTVPYLFLEAFQTAEDYYVRTIYASGIRILRFIAFAITILAPGVYVALTTYHQELIPTTLLFTIAAGREGTPFPAFIEAIIMVFAFEILREAGIRLPRPVGTAISIVGALVMGEAAVSAGIVGSTLVIVIAITAVAGFIVPILEETISSMRLLVLISASALGGFGITMCIIAMFIHIGGLKSFGVEYYGGLTLSRSYEDSYIRMPLWFMEDRPKNIAWGNIKRRQYFVPPARPHKEK